MDNQLRGIILKLQNRLSEGDRVRLHFFFGNYVPRTIRDDLSLRGTLNLMDYLFDQDTINENDFTFLINAFDDIQCTDACKLLKEHLRRIQLNEANQSIESLSLIMPYTINQLIEDEDEDRYALEHPLINQQNICSNTTNINRMPMTTCDQKTFHKESKRKKRLKSKMIVGICLVIYTLLLPIIGYGLQRFSPLRDILGCDRLEKKNNQSIEIIQQLKDQIKQLDEKLSIRHGCPHGGPGGGQFNDLEDLTLGPMASCIGVELFWNSELLFAIGFIYQQENSSISKIYRGGFGKPSEHIGYL